MKKTRIDILLVKIGCADSLKEARAMVMTGTVLVNEQRVEKPSQEFGEGVKIRLKGAAKKSRYVGRGGLKLEKALAEFQICSNDYVCLDIGASTGGFTDCLLQHGAKRVITIDAGTNQLDWKLRCDKARVEVRENVNARYLKPSDFNERFDLIVVDVSFISVTKILSALKDLLTKNGKIIVLIKPQFEVKRNEVGRGGIIRDSEKHAEIIEKINDFSSKLGLNFLQITDSPILGAEGNKEFLALYEKAK